MGSGSSGVLEFREFWSSEFGSSGGDFGIPDTRIVESLHVRDGCSMRVLNSHSAHVSGDFLKSSGISGKVLMAQATF